MKYLKGFTVVGSFLMLMAMMATAAFAGDVTVSTGSAGGFIQFIVYLLIAGIIFGLLLFLVNKAPFIPAEAKTIIVYIIYFVAVLFIISLLLSLIGKPLW